MQNNLPLKKDISKKERKLLKVKLRLQFTMQWIKRLLERLKFNSDLNTN